GHVEANGRGRLAIPQSTDVVPCFPVAVGDPVRTRRERPPGRRPLARAAPTALLSAAGGNGSTVPGYGAVAGAGFLLAVAVRRPWAFLTLLDVTLVLALVLGVGLVVVALCVVVAGVRRGRRGAGRWRSRRPSRRIVRLAGLVRRLGVRRL